MAERSGDEKDAALRRMFATDPVPDDGFSIRVVRRIRRRQTVRRLLVPGAAVFGASIAAKPAGTLLTTANGSLMQFAASLEAGFQPGTSIVAAAVPGVLLFAVLVCALRLLEE